MPTARAKLAEAAVGGIVYAIGGSDHGCDPAHGGSYNTVEAYDPVTDTWTTKASMPTARNSLAAAVVNGIVYAIGGQNGPNSYSTVEAYDPVTDTWTTKASMPGARNSLAAAAVNGIVYAIGGIFEYGIVEAYDPVTNTWTTKAPMPTARNTLAAAAVNGIVYAIGGYNDGWRSAVEGFDPVTDTWSTEAAMLAARAELAAAVVDGIVYAIGGGFRLRRSRNERGLHASASMYSEHMGDQGADASGRSLSFGGSLWRAALCA
jgi:N-acetylneuraminic acid mutarotase